MTFIKNVSDSLVYYTIESFEKTGLVRHGFSTRLGGASTDHLSSLNLGIKKNDKKQNVLNNYKIYTKSLGVDINNLVLTDQVHKDNILEVDEEDRGKGLTKETDIFDIDGFITNKIEVALVTFYADCVPLFLLDPVKKAIGLSHAGWKGTVSQIGKKTLKKMMLKYGSNPKDVLIGIGPSIGKCCYEVGGELIEILEKDFKNSRDYYYKKNDGKFMLDLQTLNKDQFLNMGVQEGNITISNICTNCNKDEFFSHRGDDGNTGSLAAILELK